MTLKVLVVSTDVAHVMATRRAARERPIDALVEWAGTCHEGLRRARELPAELVIVNCTGDLAESTALLRHLRQRQPATEVLAFADVDGAACEPSVSAWPWSALSAVLDERLDLRLKLLGLPRDAVVRD